MSRQLTVFVTEIHVFNTQERTKKDGKEDHEENPQEGHRVHEWVQAHDFGDGSSVMWGIPFDESEMKSIGRRNAKCAYTKERPRANAQQNR